MIRLLFIGDWRPWIAFAAALALGAGAWALYRRETRGHRGVAAWLPPLLRATAVAMLVLMLAGPVLRHRWIVGQLAHVLVFVDSSRSMGVPDSTMEPRRKLLAAERYGWLSSPDLPKDLRSQDPSAPGAQAAAESILQSSPLAQKAMRQFDSLSRFQREQLLLCGTEGERSLLADLSTRHNLDLLAFDGAEVKPLWRSQAGGMGQSSEPPKALAVDPAGQATDIGSCLRALLAESDATNAGRNPGGPV